MHVCLLRRAKNRRGFYPLCVKMSPEEWVETWRPIVDMVSDLIGEDIEYHQCLLALRIACGA